MPPPPFFLLVAEEKLSLPGNLSSKEPGASGGAGLGDREGRDLHTEPMVSATA